MSGWKAEFDGYSWIWIRRRWKVGPLSRMECVALWPSGGAQRMSHRVLAFLDEGWQKRVAAGPWRLATVFWGIAYALAARLDRDEEIGLDSLEWRKKWPFAVERVPRARREERLRKLGL